MDERQQERILHWLEEEEDDVIGGEDDEDENNIYPDEISEHNTDSEQECEDGDIETSTIDHEHASKSPIDQQMDSDDWDSDDNQPLINLSSRNLCRQKKGRRGNYKTICKWRKTPYPQAVRTRRQNIVTEQSGPQGAAREVSDPLESWLLFWDVDMLQHIVTAYEEAMCSLSQENR